MDERKWYEELLKFVGQKHVWFTLILLALLALYGPEVIDQLVKLIRVIGEAFPDIKLLGN